MKVCVIKTSSMGDVIHTLPALTDAQKVIPNLSIDWVVEENFAEIPRWHPSVNRVIPIALRRWRKSPFSIQTRNEWKNYRTLLQAENYDAVIDAQGLIKSALFATRFAQGVKHGYDRQSIREPLASFFYELSQVQGDYGIARHFLHQTSEKNYVVFIHSTTRADKHWKESEWQKLIEKITALSDCEIRLPWGNELEKARAERLAQVDSKVIVLPKLTLTELAEQLANAQAVVSVDTGLAHLTAALDKPNITLYGSTDPKLIGCYGKNQYYLSASSMKEISAEQVLSQLLPFIS